ncbi:periplasmic sensor signal transduction histidine kinase [beta proteobacterium KB13]|uniref:histidine kinase n=1 Tax=beta proteobacterium KB13 TaxID=314607 RepID=B6BVF9_9PROT|nr:periplasmic sensor signal transduction histidine kinase [beta proteobacterium KB13]
MRYLLTSALVISLSLLVILIRSLSNSDFISSETFQLLLKINLAFVVLLFIFIALQVYRLFKEVKKEVTGSRLTLRLVISYSIMIIVPLMVLYFVSVNFLTKSIESWFNVRVESALESGLNIGQKTLDILRKDVELKSRSISYSLSNSKIKEFNPVLSDLTEKFDIYDAMIIDEENRIMAISSKDNIEIDSVLPDEQDLILANTGFHGKIDITQENIIFLKTFQPYILIDDKIQKKFYLIITQKIPESISEAALSVESVFEDYQALTFSRNSLKVIYQITLSIILFLAILLSISLALYFSRRFTMPLSILSEATQSIAKGNFKKKIPDQGKDELGMLVRSFNTMTTKLESANKTLELNRQRIESSRNFLESIINNMSSGIIVIDPKSNIRLTNKLASKLLGFNLELLIGQRFNQILEYGAQFEEIVTLINKSKDSYKEKALTLKFKRRILSIQLTEQGTGKNKNKIILIDDISEITAAQRNEAWSEVARRLAHEIKNPLTPIQLSAERIDHKFSKQLEKNDQTILSDITKTIVNQVDAIKKMVNEFTEYSRSPELTKSEINLVDLLNELVNLFQKEDLKIKISSRSKKINFTCDEIKIRQVFVNLINNAYEAKKEDNSCEIEIRLRKTRNALILNFIDNGTGVNDDINIFEPYVTTKKTGTGLGLAVVKKIIDEHDGSITIKNNKISGANVEIHFSY